MLFSESKELIIVRELIDKSELDEAEQLIESFEEKKGHTLYDIVLCHHLKCMLLGERGFYEDAVKFGEETYKESLKLGKNLLSVDILLEMALGLLNIGQTDKAHDINKQCEELLKTLTSISPTEYKQRKAYIAFVKGWIYSQKIGPDQSIKEFELSLSLREELGIKKDIAYSLYGIANIYMFQQDFDRALSTLERGMSFAKDSGNKLSIGGILYCMGRVHKFKVDFDRSIMYLNRSLAIYKDLNNKFMISRNLNALGEIYGNKGELDNSIRVYEQSLELLKEIDNKLFIADVFNSLAFCYKMKGELDRALECVKQSMTLTQELGTFKAFNNHFLIQIYIDKGDLERAQSSLIEFEQLNSKIKYKQINSMYLLDKALLLKTSSRALNRGKAEEILKQILEDGDLHYNIKIEVLLNLCELLLTDLQITNDLEVLQEIKPYITELLDLSDKTHSFWILGETYLLQAKLSLISLNLEEARKLLTQGQKIAENYGLSLLAKKISNEHDELLKQLKVWENLKESKAPLKERIELASLNEQMENMMHKRAIEGLELSNEEPVYILIVTEGGRPIFSQSFIEDQKFEDHLFGGFFSAINSFIGEMFSEGLDRASFGEHTLLMHSVPPFFMCYVFKGQSYSAQQKVIEFIDKIQTNDLIWHTFNKFNQANKEIQKKDIPSLEPLINEIFISKTRQFN